MSVINLFNWRLRQRVIADRHNLPDLRNDEDRVRYRKLLCNRREAKRQLATLRRWRRDAIDETQHLPALLRRQAE